MRPLPQHSLVQWPLVAWLEAGGEQLAGAWQVVGVRGGDGRFGSVVEATVEAVVVCSFCFACLFVKKKKNQILTPVSSLSQPGDAPSGLAGARC